MTEQTAIQPEHEPTYSLDKWIARRRREIGEARWQQLVREWEQDK